MLKKIKNFIKKQIFPSTLSWVIVIAEIFIGVYIDDIIDFNSNKKAEEIRLKAKVAEHKIDITTELLSMIQEPILILKTQDSKLAQSLPGYDGSINSCSVILKDYNTFGEWTTKFHQLTSKNRFLFNEEINLYITQIYLYDQKLNYILSSIPEDDVWQVGVILHSEISYMYENLSQMLQKYLNEGVYVLENSTINSYSRVIELPQDMYIVKYEQQIISALNE